MARTRHGGFDNPHDRREPCLCYIQTGPLTRPSPTGQARAMTRPWKSGCHAAYSYSWIRPPRTSRRRSRPTFGRLLAPATCDGTGVA